MVNKISLRERVAGALYGMFIGDALAMPVHWYYDTQALRKDYGVVADYLQPRNPHPDSILWRSAYKPTTKEADILHEQSKFWGVKNIHYHQFLKAGENTLNIKLARELLWLMHQKGVYDKELWLTRMVSFLTTPGNHKDTYVEEYLREFFVNYSAGKPLDDCGRKDEHHIGGYSLMIPVLLAYGKSPDFARKISIEHLALTHGGSAMRKWGKFLVTAMLNLLEGCSLVESCLTAVNENRIEFDVHMLKSFESYPDNVVIGRHFSSACYVEQAVPATIFLALKYSHLPEKCLIQNTMCGGDNAGRGAVLGSLMGALHGIDGWPERWKNLLTHPPPVTLFE